MKIIDLLNKIAKGEEIPKKVEYCGVIFENKNGDLLNDLDCSLFEHRGDGDERLLPMLNDEVEVIEDKKIEKFDPCLGGIMSFDSVEHIFETYKDKINEIIDYLQSKGDK